MRSLAIALLLVANAYAGDDDCVLEAQIWEAVSEMAPEAREQLRVDTLAMRDSSLVPVVMKALNAADAGLSPAEAWLRCGSY